jgi:hypothetical protein
MDGLRIRVLANIEELEQAERMDLAKPKEKFDWDEAGITKKGWKSILRWWVDSTSPEITVCFDDGYAEVYQYSADLHEKLKSL